MIEIDHDAMQENFERRYRLDLNVTNMVTELLAKTG